MALIFGHEAVFRKSILRSNFAVSSLKLRCSLLVGALLYLGVDRLLRAERNECSSSIVESTSSSELKFASSALPSYARDPAQAFDQ